MAKLIKKVSNLTVFCPIHGLIEMSPLTVKILNTPEMQRLRDLKQLGAIYYVFPSGTHSRLEHSIGVSHLAREMTKKLQREHPDMEISDRMVELIGIAGLVHDIGHGPFSHLYDHYVKDDDEPEHEERGLKMFRDICARESLGLSEEDVEDICLMIDPSGEKKYNWKYQIVANKSCDIDVDKIDYIQRDSYHLGIPHTGEMNRLIQMVRINKTDKGNELTWDRKIEFDIYSLFANRYRLHRQVYQHHTVCAFEFIIIKIMEKLRDVYNVSLATETDTIVSQFCYSNPEDELSKAMMQREHPHMYDELVLIDKQKESYKGFFHFDEGIILEDIKIGFVSGDKENPLKNVNYYNGKELHPNNTFKLEPGKSSFIIPDQFQEIILRMYALNEDVPLESLESAWKELKDHYESKYVRM